MGRRVEFAENDLDGFESRLDKLTNAINRLTLCAFTATISFSVAIVTVLTKR